MPEVTYEYRLEWDVRHRETWSGQARQSRTHTKLWAFEKDKEILEEAQKEGECTNLTAFHRTVTTGDWVQGPPPHENVCKDCGKPIKQTYPELAEYLQWVHTTQEDAANCPIRGTDRWPVPATSDTSE